jgi:hypothetical protein
MKKGGVALYLSPYFSLSMSESKEKSLRAGLRRL